MVCIYYSPAINTTLFFILDPVCSKYVDEVLTKISDTGQQDLINFNGNYQDQFVKLSEFYLNLGFLSD